MQPLTQQIELQKQAIQQKRQQIETDCASIKQRMTSPSGLGWAALGGVALLFLLSPKKIKLLKTGLKFVGLISTANRFMSSFTALKRSNLKN